MLASLHPHSPGVGVLVSIVGGLTDFSGTLQSIKLDGTFARGPAGTVTAVNPAKKAERETYRAVLFTVTELATGNDGFGLSVWC